MINLSEVSTIKFPNLFWGIELNINRVAFSIGPVKVYWYGIIISAAFLLAVLLAMKDSKKFGIDSENIIDVVLVATIPAIIFARLYYVIFNIDLYIDTPIEILKVWNGGLAIYGGIIGALLTAYIYCRVKKISVLKLFDFGMPYFALAQAIGRWGNMINQEAFGTNTSLPWGMTGDLIEDELYRLKNNVGLDVDPSLPVHPTFLYESLWDLAVFIFLMWFRRRKKNNGEVFFLYLILYGAGRVWIEGLRTDSLMIWGTNIRVSQLLSVLLIVIFTFLFVRMRKNTLKPAEEIELGKSEYGSVLRKFAEETEKPQESYTEDTVNENDTSSNKDEYNINENYADNAENDGSIGNETQENNEVNDQEKSAEDNQENKDADIITDKQ